MTTDAQVRNDRRPSGSHGLLDLTAVIADGQVQFAALVGAGRGRGSRFYRTTA
jgi:hypothetical protein